MAHFKTSDGLSLYYEDTGQGQPVLCLPGLTRNCRDFDPLAQHLTDVRLIRLDYRGRGKSDHDPEFNNYNVLCEARDVIELLDHLQLDRVSVIGTSRGGLIAMVLAAGHAARLSGVILNDVGPEVSAEGIARIMDYVGRAPGFTSFDQAAERIMAAMAPRFPDVPLSVWRQQAEAQYHSDGDTLALSYDPRLRDALLAQIEAGPPPDLWPLFEALAPIPTAVLRGENSDLLSPETLAAMQARKPDLLVVEVSHRGHVPFLDEPEALAAVRRILEATAWPALQ